MPGANGRTTKVTRRAIFGRGRRPSDGERPPFAAPRGPIDQGTADGLDRERGWAARRGRGPVNQLIDRAGRYRRVAAGLVLMAIPLVQMGLTAIGRGRWPIYGFAHLALAGSCIWLATDLIRTGSLIDARSRLHRSCVVLGVSIVLAGALRPGGFDGFSPHGWAAPGLVTLLLAVVVLVVAERRSDIGASMIGRYLGVIGACGLAVVIWTRSIQVFWVEPGYAIGLGAVALIVLATALSEAWLLARGLALFRLRLRRGTHA